MVEAANSPTITPRLRGEIATSAFVRAILLDDDTAARALAPIAEDAQPGLRKSIDVWLAAKTPTDRKFALDFLILQNPGLKFTIAQGAGRTTPLDEVDGFRDNWLSNYMSPQKDLCPAFLSPSEKQTAVVEWNKFASINAPNFLCTGAIERAKTDPKDDRLPEALYRCISAVHLGCSNKASTPLAKSAFQLLHRHYPKSAWAAKAHFWYIDNGCT